MIEKNDDDDHGPAPDRNSLARILINDNIALTYTSTDDPLQAFVADNGAVYVKYWAHKGHLFLAHLPDKPRGKLSHANTVGTYDRNDQRKVTAIYLPREEVMTAKYNGTIDDLLARPDIRDD
ncbi:MAG: hypothetical protein ACMXX5_01425, partial [Candidatus Woesearchaeota archaeon]